MSQDKENFHNKKAKSFNKSDKKPSSFRNREDGGEKRPYTPRGSSAGGDRKPYARRPEGDGERRPYTPRGSSAGGDRKPYARRPEGDGERRPYTPRSSAGGDRKPYGRSAEGGDRKPYARRPEGDGERRPYTPRSSSAGGDRKPYARRPEGDGERRPYTPRSSASGDRKPYGRSSEGGDRKPYARRPEGDGERRPYTPRGSASGDRKPYSKRPDNFEDKKPYGRRDDNERKSYGRESENDSGNERKTYTRKPEGETEERKPYAKKPEGENTGRKVFKDQGFFRKKEKAPHNQTSEFGNTSPIYLYGFHPVSNALLNPLRTNKRLFCTQSSRKTLEPILNELIEKDLKLPEIIEVEKDEIGKMLPKDSVNQGIMLDCEPLDEVFLSDILIKASDNAKIIILDKVTDPHNVGAIMRSGAALGAIAVIMQKLHSPEITGVLAKSACGAVEHIALIKEINLNRAIDKLKEAGFRCIGLDEKGERTISEVDSSGKIALILGAEGDGIRQSVVESCDELVKLPTKQPIASLNVSNAAAIGLYELVRNDK